MALLWPLPARCPLTHLPRDPCPTFPPRDSFQRAAALSSARRGDLAFLPQRSAVPQAARRGAIPCICSAGKKILEYFKVHPRQHPGTALQPQIPILGWQGQVCPRAIPLCQQPPMGTSCSSASAAFPSGGFPGAERLEITFLGKEPRWLFAFQASFHAFIWEKSVAKFGADRSGRPTANV